MKTFLKTLRIFFVILGVIFFLIIVAGFYLYQTNFYGVKTMMNYEKGKSIMDKNSDLNNNREIEDKNPSLSAEQEAQLEKSGINPAALPTEITPEMKICFVDKLGQERVKNIENGASPTPLELIKVEPCF